MSYKNTKRPKWESSRATLRSFANKPITQMLAIGVSGAVALWGCTSQPPDQDKGGGVTFDPDFRTSVCIDYAKPVLPPGTDLCLGDSKHGTGLFSTEAGRSLVQHLILDKDPKTGENCYQTLPDAPKQWRICDREGDPYYFEKAPLVANLMPPTEPIVPVV